MNDWFEAHNVFQMLLAAGVFAYVVDTARRTQWVARTMSMVAAATATAVVFVWYTSIATVLEGGDTARWVSRAVHDVVLVAFVVQAWAIRRTESNGGGRRRVNS